MSIMSALPRVDRLSSPVWTAMRGNVPQAGRARAGPGGPARLPGVLSAVPAEGRLIGEGLAVGPPRQRPDRRMKPSHDSKPASRLNRAIRHKNMIARCQVRDYQSQADDARLSWSR